MTMADVAFLLLTLAFFAALAAATRLRTGASTTEAPA